MLHDITIHFWSVLVTTTTPVEVLVDEVCAWLDTVRNFSDLARHSGVTGATIRTFRRKKGGSIMTLEKLIAAKRNGPPPPYLSW